MTSTRIPHSRPLLPVGAEWAEVTDRLQPGWVADGECTRQFESELAPWLGGVGSVAVNSGSNALHLALLAVGVRPGQAVLIPSYSCAALNNAVRQAGAIPALYDAVRGGIQPDVDDALRRKPADLGAVVVIHTFGQALEVTPFRALGVPIIEDCAQCLGLRVGEEPAGALGDASIGSFFATKVITTGHGGAVTSGRQDVLARARDLIHYDNRSDLEPRLNYRFTELQAALGLWQLARLPAFLNRRRALADYYDRELLAAGWSLEALRGVRSPSGSIRAVGGPTMHFRYVIRVADAETAIQQLQARGIDARRPVHRPFHLHDHAAASFPGALSAHREIISVPLYPALSDAEAETVAAALLTTLTAPAEITRE